MSTLPPNWTNVILCFMDFQTTWLTSYRLYRMPLQELLPSQRKLFILTAVLRKLHWLRNKDGIIFKVLLSAYKGLNGLI